MGLGLPEAVKLTEKQKKVYELVRIKRHTISEAARILGCGKPTAYYHLRRAENKITKFMRDQEIEVEIKRLEEEVRDLRWAIVKHYLEHLGIQI